MSRFESVEEPSNVRDAKGAKTSYIHPVWRGIGFAMIVLTPIMGWAAAVLLLDLNTQNKWMAVPRDLLISWRDPYILIKLILTIVIALLIFLVYQLITFFLYRVTGPSRYGPMDVPPVRYTGKKYKR
jgi:hypothetical protein